MARDAGIPSCADIFSAAMVTRTEENSCVRCRSLCLPPLGDVSQAEVRCFSGHASVEQPGTITPKPDMLRDLNNRGITVAAEKMSAQLGMPHHAPLEGLRMTGKHVGTIDLPMHRLAASSKAARSSRLFRGSRSC